MLQSKLIELIRTFSYKQVNGFHKFLQSPYFNSSGDLLKFYEYIKQFAPNFKSKKLDRFVTFEKLYGKKYSDRKMAYLMNDTINMIHEYFKMELLQDEKVLGASKLLEYYSQLGLEKHYKGIMRDARKEQEQLSKASEFFYNDFLLDKAEYAVSTHMGQRTFEESLQSLIDNLDLYYLAEKLKYSVEIASRKSVITNAYELKFIDEVRNYLKEKPNLNFPYIKINYEILMMYLEEEKGETHFAEVRRLLDKHKNDFTPAEMEAMYLFPANYCVGQINAGKTEYYQLLYDLYIEQLEAGFANASGYLSPFKFKNLVVLSLRLGRKQETLELFDKYINLIEDKHKENSFNYNMAYYYFYMNDYDKVMELLMQVEFSDVYYNADAKMIQIKTYYETNEFEALTYFLNAFKIFIKRNKQLPDDRKDLYLNFSLYVGRLMRINKNTPEKAQKLLDKLTVATGIPDKRWLLNKVEKFI